MLLWVLLWVVLVLGAGAVFGLLGRTLWRKAKALTTEIGEVSDRLTGVLAALNDEAAENLDQPAERTTTRAGVRAGGRRDRRARPH